MAAYIDTLKQQHITGNQTIEHIEQLGSRLTSDEAVTLVNTMEAEILNHFNEEETRLFPALEAVIGSHCGPTSVMRAEHEAIRQQIDTCKAAIAEGVDVLSAELDTLFILLQQHNVKEENVLYPLCEQCLPQLATWLPLALEAS
ncbi:hemerythrin domain-containing protein [Burkholderiaceae bacterium DAT-1]|nr:hemerythrin domain-containing protein [Burkholderiaceae bacterium DAT-1]